MRSTDSWDQREEGAVGPDSGRVVAFGQRDLGQLIIERAGELGLEPVADREARGGAVGRVDDRQRMVGAGDDRVAAVEASGRCGAARASPAIVICVARKAVASTSMVSFSTGVTSTWLPSGSRRSTEANRRTIAGRPIGWPSWIPAAVARDAHSRMAAMLGIPAVDRRRAATRLDRRGERGEAQAGIDRWARFGHWFVIARNGVTKQSSLADAGLLRCARNDADMSATGPRSSREEANVSARRSFAHCSMTVGRLSRMSIMRPTSCPMALSRQSPTWPKPTAPSGFSPRPKARCGCWSTMRRGSCSMDSARRALRSSMRT